MGADDAISSKFIDASGQMETIPELELAVERETASSGDVFVSYFGQYEWHTSSAERRAAYKHYYPKIRAVFEDNHGSINDFFFCKNIAAGIILNEKNDIFIQYDSGQFPEAEKLLYKGHVLAAEANEFLDGKDQRRILEGVYDVTNAVMALMDRAAEERPGRMEIFAQDPRLYDALRTEVEDVESQLVRMTQRRAQTSYFWGMTAGLGIPLLAAIVLCAILALSKPDFDAGPIAGALLGGAVGAWVSVIARITSGKFRLDYRAGHDQLKQLGLFRPIVGSVFALAIFFVVSGNLLPIQVTRDGLRELYFFTALGFLAGFQERLAQDMLSIAGRRYSTPASPASD